MQKRDWEADYVALQGRYEALKLAFLETVRLVVEAEDDVDELMERCTEMMELGEEHDLQAEEQAMRPAEAACEPPEHRPTFVSEAESVLSDLATTLAEKYGRPITLSYQVSSYNADGEQADDRHVAVPALVGGQPTQVVACEIVEPDVGNMPSVDRWCRLVRIAVDRANRRERDAQLAEDAA